MAAKPPPLELGGANEPLMDENSICPGCKLSVVDEAGGVVVAFGCVLVTQWTDPQIHNRAIQAIVFSR
jgi:hypothetical protein